MSTTHSSATNALPTSPSTVQESQAHASVRPNFAQSSSSSSELKTQSTAQPHKEGQMSVGEQGDLHKKDVEDTEGSIAKITSGLGGMIVNAPLAAIEKVSPSFAQGLTSAASSVATGVQNLASTATHAAAQYNQAPLEASKSQQSQAQPATTASVEHAKPATTTATGSHDSTKQPGPAVAETLPTYSSTGTSQVQEQSTITRSTADAQGVGAVGGARSHMEGIEAPGTRVLVQPPPGTNMSNEEREMGGPTVPSAAAAEEKVAESLPPADEAVGQGVETVKAAGNKAAEMLPPAERQKELAQATAENVAAAGKTAYSAAASAAPVVADKSAQATSTTAAGLGALATGVVHGAQAAAHAAAEGAHRVQDYVTGTAESASNAAQAGTQRAVETGKSATNYAADTARSATNAAAETARSAQSAAADTANVASQKASDVGQTARQKGESIAADTTSSYPLASTPSDFTPGTAKILSGDSLEKTEQRYREEDKGRPVAAIMDHPDSSTQDKHEGVKSEMRRVHDEPAVTRMFPSQYPDESARQHERDVGATDTSASHHAHYSTGNEGYQNKMAQKPPTSRDTHTPSHVDHAHWGGDPVVYGASSRSHDLAQSERNSSVQPSSGLGGAGIDMQGSGSPHTYSSATKTSSSALDTSNLGAAGLSEGNQHHWVSGQPLTGAAESAATKEGRGLDRAAAGSHASTGQHVSSADQYATTAASRYA